MALRLWNAFHSGLSRQKDFRPTALQMPRYPITRSFATLSDVVPFGMKFLFGFLSMIFGCSESKSLPDDFKLVLSFTASQPGNPGQTITLVRQPDKSYVLINASDWADSAADTKKISQDDVAVLYSQIITSNVFKLKDSYADMNVLDGGTTTLHIIANGKEKTIRMRNTMPEELQSTFTILGKFMAANESRDE